MSPRDLLDIVRPFSCDCAPAACDEFELQDIAQEQGDEDTPDASAHPCPTYAHSCVYSDGEECVREACVCDAGEPQLDDETKLMRMASWLTGMVAREEDRIGKQDSSYSIKTPRLMALMEAVNGIAKVR